MPGLHLLPDFVPEAQEQARRCMFSAAMQQAKAGNAYYSNTGMQSHIARFRRSCWTQWRQAPGTLSHGGASSTLALSSGGEISLCETSFHIMPAGDANHALGPVGTTQRQLQPWSCNICSNGLNSWHPAAGI